MPLRRSPIVSVAHLSGALRAAQGGADAHGGGEALLAQRRSQHGPQHEAQGDAAGAVAQADGPVLQWSTQN